jgi:GNAT superfamily N-acetyltransferase
MKCIIGNQEYSYINDVIKDDGIRMSYLQLAKQSFGLDFEKWYQSGYWDDRFIPYILMHEGTAVSSVGVCINDLYWQDQSKRYVQISTVMTLPEFRNKGLNRYLMETVLSEWRDKCDGIYLYANDSVVDFYPKFGFEEFKEYQYSKAIFKGNGTYRKLDILNPQDWDLVMKKYLSGNPFSKFKVDNLGLFVFHCLHTVSNDIYYIEKYDALVIAQFEDNKIYCYDVFTDYNCQIDDILSIMANENTDIVCLGFTPSSPEGYKIAESQEEGTHLFVLKGKDNILVDCKIKLNN